MRLSWCNARFQTTKIQSREIWATGGQNEEVSLHNKKKTFSSYNKDNSAQAQNLNAEDE